jgi:RNA polymerase sigma-70 factor, ECF subfamily
MTFIVTTRDVPLTNPSEDAADTAASSLMSEAEFRAFYERSSRQVWLYLARITGDRQIADDLLQETFYRFYRAGGSHENERHRRNVLFKIATNIARDNYRRRHGTEEVELHEEIATHGSESSSIELRTDLARAFDRLKPQQREMLWLAYAHGSSHDEIAAATGVTPGSVKALLFRARRKLASILQGDAR